MQADQFVSALRTRPFRAFTVVTADGSKLTVTHPETVAFSPSKRTVVIVTEKEHHVLDMGSITKFSVRRVPRAQA